MRKKGGRVRIRRKDTWRNPSRKRPRLRGRSRPKGWRPTARRAGAGKHSLRRHPAMGRQPMDAGGTAATQRRNVRRCGRQKIVGWCGKVNRFRNRGRIPNLPDHARPRDGSLVHDPTPIPRALRLHYRTRQRMGHALRRRPQEAGRKVPRWKNISPHPESPPA